MTKLKLIQAGLGGWGRNWQQNVLSTYPRIEIVAYVDSDPAIRKILPKELKVDKKKCFGSLKEALETVQTDTVLITAHVDGHAPLMREALEAGKHVLVEKPFTRSVEQAKELVALAEKEKRVLMVSQNYRYYPAPQAVKKIIADKSLGTVGSVHIDFRRSSGLTAGKDSKHTRLIHPLLLDMAIHHFDLLRMVLGQNPTKVFCHTYNPPWSLYNDPPAAFGIIVFPDDVPVSYRGSWISHNTQTPWAGMWEIECENGMLLWRSRKGGPESANQDSVIIRHYSTLEEEVPLSPLLYTDRAGTLDSFVSAVNAKQTGDCSGFDNLGTIAFMNAMIQSAEEGQFVLL